MIAKLLLLLFNNGYEEKKINNKNNNKTNKICQFFFLRPWTLILLLRIHSLRLYSNDAFCKNLI